MGTGASGYWGTQNSGFLLDKAGPKVMVHAFSEELPRMWEKMYNVISSNQPWEEFGFTSPMGFSSVVDEFTGPGFDAPREGQAKLVRARRRGLASYVSADLMEDSAANPSEARKILDVQRWLGFSLRQSIEFEAHAVLANEAFNSALQTTADGLAIYATSHLHADGTTFDNTWAAARPLNQPNLVAAINGIRGQGLGRGHKTGMGRGRLVLLTGDSQNHRAIEILGTQKQVDSNNNNKNPLQAENIIHVNSPYVDGNHWSVHDLSGTAFKAVMRKRPTFSRDSVFITKGQRYMGLYRVAFANVANGLGSWGTQGA